MKRRLPGIGARVGGRDESRPEQPAAGADEVSLVWMQSWGEHEEHRVAQWLTARCGTFVGTDADIEVVPDDADPAFDPFTVPVAPTARETAAPPHGGTHAQASSGGHSRSFLEAEIHQLEDARRRLTEALVVERREAERERRERQLLRSDLEAEITRLEEQRRRVLLAAEAATLAADRATNEHHEVVAQLEIARLDARRREAEHFELWCSLDVEVSALKARLRRLRALHRRRS